MIKFSINQRVGKKVGERWAEKIVKTVFKKTGVRNADVSLALVGSGEIKKWNKLYRGKNLATDVLSFVYSEKPLDGEIIICYSKVVRQAKEKGHTVNDEIEFLLVHGLLHLCGYDHEKSAREEKIMDNLQNKIISVLRK